MSWLRSSSIFPKLAASLALLALAGLGASVCLCVHATPKAASTPSCHAAGPVETAVEAALSSACCRAGHLPVPVLALDLRAPKKSQPSGEKIQAFAADLIHASLSLARQSAAAFDPLDTAPPPSPPPSFVLPLRI